MKKTQTDRTTKVTIVEKSEGTNKHQGGGTVNPSHEHHHHDHPHVHRHHHHEGAVTERHHQGHHEDFTNEFITTTNTMPFRDMATTQQGFFGSDESGNEEEEVHHLIHQKKPRSKRYYESLKEARRNQRMMKLKSKENKRSGDYKSQIEECLALEENQQLLKENRKMRSLSVRPIDEEEEEFYNEKAVPAKHKLQFATQPRILPAKTLIRKDGVQIFTDHPTLSKPKPPRPFTGAEINARRRCSNVLISIPPAVDEADRDDRRSKRTIQKTIRYIKRSWRVKINRKNAMKEISHRLNQRLYIARPVDSWVKRRDREKLAENTGFYSSKREHYKSLGNVETDTPMLVFKNLPPDLRITPTHWLKAIADKEELRRKRDTPLPRLPRARVRRPSYAKGRIKIDAGGQKMITEFVKVAEMFQKGIRGSQTYANLLDIWTRHKEDVAANRASPFGILRRQNLMENIALPVMQPDRDDDRLHLNMEKKKRDSFAVDDRTFQREMHYLEKMMSAMYNLIKSLLNITPDQVSSKLPLPNRAIGVLRDHSPDSKPAAIRKAPFAIFKTTNHPDLYTPAMSTAQSEREIHSFVRTALATREELEHLGEHEEEHEEVEEKVLNEDVEPRRQYYTDNIPYMPKSKVLRPKTTDLKVVLKDPENLVPQDIISLSPPQSSRRVLDAIRMVHDLTDERDHRMNLSAEKKIENMFENPEHASKRLARNEATYLKLFHPGKKTRKPIWHRVKIGRFQETKKSEETENEAATNVDIVTSQIDTSAIVEQALVKRRNMQSQRFPDEEDIKTPALPGAVSEEVITSEEQSRLNLLKKAPDAAQIVAPPTPIRRLYRMAGIRTTEKDFYQTLMEMKRPFRNTEKKLRLFYENEIDKYDWETLKRYRVKLKAITPNPIYKRTIQKMRQAMNHVDIHMEQSESSNKRAAPWYKKLVERAESAGAFLHHGCQATLVKLQKYCDVDMKSRPHMLSRCCLLVVSLPVTELAETYWQDAISFILEELIGAPVELFHHWLRYRNLPYLL